jgi:hypothetical protein
LDIAGGKMYWVNQADGKIQRANLVGTDVEDVVTGLDIPRGIALNVGWGKVYWTDINSDKIQRANLDGSNIENLLTGLGNPIGIALDLAQPVGGYTTPINKFEFLIPVITLTLCVIVGCIILAYRKAYS